MTASTDRLIHLVLDGEATPDERRTLERLAAADPEVAARLAEVRQLLAALDRLPQKHPPEGLVAAVMAKIPQMPPFDEDEGKLSTASRVFGATTTDTGHEIPGTADHRRIHVPAATRGSFGMSEQTNGSGKRTLIIGAGVLAVAVAAAIGTGVLPVGQNTSGTIVPAQRFIAPQNTAVGVQQDARPRTTEPLPPAAGAAAGAAQGAAEAGARGAAEAGARGAAEAGARGAAEAGARGSAEAGARGAAEAGARGAAEAGARGAAEAGARGAAEAGAKGSAQAGARGAAEAGARGAAEAGARGSAEAGARGAAEAGARGAAEAGAKGSAQAGARGAAEAGARGAAEAGARGAAEAGARGAAEAGARGAADSGARGAAEAGAKGAAQAGAK